MRRRRRGSARTCAPGCRRVFPSCPGLSPRTWSRGRRSGGGGRRCSLRPAGDPLGADPHVRQRVADLWARALVHHTISQRVISGAAAGEPPGPVTSIGKLYFCPLVEDLADFRLSLGPLAGQFGLDDTSPEAADARRWLRLAIQARGTAIAGGSTFIQRNIVAERVLGMPRG